MSNGKIISFALMAGLWTTSCTAAPARLSLANVSPGDLDQAVTAKLGKPIDKSTSEGFSQTVFHYRKLNISFDEEGKVTEIDSSDSKFCVNKSICPGMSLSALRKGMPDLVSIESNSDRYQGMADGDGCWVEVSVKNSTVQTVSVVCQP
jgi:hypothetical protein